MYVYRNLKIKTHCVWKLSDKPKSAATNKQVASVVLANVSFHFLPGQCRFMERTRRETGTSHRQVGAFAVGEIIAAAPNGTETEITYNPNRCAWAFTTRDGKPVTHCAFVRFDATGAYAIGDVR
jgi:hypothetical protein